LHFTIIYNILYNNIYNTIYIRYNTEQYNRNMNNLNRILIKLIGIEIGDSLIENEDFGVI